MVSQSLAQHFFPHENPLGRVFTVDDPGVNGEWQIVGVARDAKYVSLREEPQRMLYLSVAQLTGDDAFAYFAELQSAGDPKNIIADTRKALALVDPNIPITMVKTLGEQVERRAANETLISNLCSFFSLVALSLACIGLYGVMTYNVTRRANEIGIRMTLGARSASVLWMILKEALMLLCIGLALGIPVTLAATHFVKSQLFGLRSNDPLTLAAAIALISSVVMLAAYFPARRATRVDPMEALRYQ